MKATYTRASAIETDDVRHFNREMTIIGHVIGGDLKSMLQIGRAKDLVQIRVQTNTTYTQTQQCVVSRAEAYGFKVLETLACISQSSLCLPPYALERWVLPNLCLGVA